MAPDPKAKLTAPALAAWLGARPGWAMAEGQLTRAFTFPDFAQGLAFVNAVGALAEAQGHHPDVGLTWGRVTVALSSHDVGGLTARDLRLAEGIDGLARSDPEA